MTKDFDSFFRPRGVVILGASSDRIKLGYAVARNLLESGFQGAIHFVNPKGGQLFNRKLHTSVAEVPNPVDLAVVIVPAGAAAQSLREVGERGIHAAILTSGGFRETGAEGALLEKEVLKVCRKYKIRLLGPNCVGLLDSHLPFDTTFLPPPMPSRGEIAFLSHSGAFCAAVIDWSRIQGFGFSRLVSLGNQADLTETDLLPALAEDQNTRTICLYLETISDGRKFMQTAAKVVRSKPVVALKVGRTAAGQKAAASHTGALASSEAALNAAFERTGILRANTAEQLFDWAQALAKCPLPKGGRIAVLTSAGGPGVIASDALAGEGLSLAECTPETEALLAKLLPPAASTHNPVDMLASAGPHEYAGGLQILLADDGVDGVMIITLPSPNHKAEEIADALIPLIKSSPKPVMVAQMGGLLTAEAHKLFVQGGIPVYPFPERAASALGALLRRATFLATKPARTVNRPARVVNIAGMTAEELVTAYHIDTLTHRLASSPEAAGSLANQIGFPMVAKIASPDIPHKSDIGGVLLNLRSPEEVRQGYETLLERARLSRPDAHIEGILLQRQVGSGQEVIIGAVRDPSFGPLMMFGSGGVEAEGLKDVGFWLAPLDEAQAIRMLQKTWAGRKLEGFRSIPPADSKAAIEALINLSWLVMDHPEIEEIEINPLRVLAQGAVALDVRLKLG